MHAVRRAGSLHEFYWRLLVGKGAEKARVAAARELSKAVLRMLRTSRSYREVESYTLFPWGRRARAPTWPLANVGVVTLQPASHTGHIVLGEGRRVSLGRARREACSGRRGDGRAALREP
jgi:hypothetical protein